MEVLREGRFFKRESELNRTAIGRAVWRHIRGDRQDAPRSYETSYKISEGYEQPKTEGP